MSEKAKRTNVDPFVFCRTWQESDTAQEVADKTGMKKLSVVQRALRYRNGVKNEDGSWKIKPVNLKKMKREGGGIRLASQVDDLNAFIENGCVDEPDNVETTATELSE